MKFFSIFKDSILRMDMLCASPTFRVRKQPSFQTVFGGLLSLTIVFAFCYIFYNKFLNVINKIDISYTQGVDDALSSTNSITGVQFAVGIDNVDLTITPRNFIFQLQQNRVGPGSTNGNIVLSPCQLSDWSSLGTDFKTQFNVFGFDKMLCVTFSQSVSLLGYAGSPNYQYLKFRIVQCNVTLDPTCDISPNINSYMSAFQISHDYFSVRFFMVNTLISPDSSSAITYFLEKKIFMAYTTTVGTVGYISIGQWTLETDTSLWPIEDYTELTGSFIQDFKTNSVSISSTRYVQIFIIKSTQQLTITRTLGKIDEVLSYVGGLFGLIFTAIAFFLSSYSEWKYEMYIAQATLTYDQSGKKYGEQDFGFMTYLMYAIYDWTDTFGIAPKFLTRWKQIHETREEACELLDPRTILRRIKHLEDITQILLNQHTELCSHLSKPMTLESARKMRNVLEYYDKIIGNLSEEQRLKINQQDQKEFDGKCITGMEISDIALRADKGKEQPDLNSQEEEELLNVLMAQSIQKLQNDKSELARRIKAKIPESVRTLVKKGYSESNQEYSKEKEMDNFEIKQNQIFSPTDNEMIGADSNTKALKLNIKRVKPVKQ